MLRSNRRLRDNESALIELFANIDREYKHLIIIVEGMRDERVLRDLGVRAPIVRTQTGVTRSELIEHILSIVADHNQVLILTDFDHEGVEMAHFLEDELEHHKVVTLKRVRLEIRRLMGNWRCIEELCSLFKRKDSPEPVRWSD